MPVQIKQKKGYPTSDGEMHDKHVDAVKAQVSINMVKAIDAAATASSDGVIDIRKFIDGCPSVISDYIKYFCIKPKAASKKKTAVKTPAIATGK